MEHSCVDIRANISYYLVCFIILTKLIELQKKPICIAKREFLYCIVFYNVINPYLIVIVRSLLYVHICRGVFRGGEHCFPQIFVGKSPPPNKFMQMLPQKICALQTPEKCTMRGNLVKIG